MGETIVLYIGRKNKDFLMLRIFRNDKTMKTDDLRFPAAATGVASPEQAPPPGGCPSPEEFLQFHRGELPRAARKAILLHLTFCPGCRDDSSFIAGMIDLERGLIRDLEKVSRKGNFLGRPVFQYLSAFLLIVVVAASAILVGRRLPADALRGRTSGRIEILAPTGASISGSAVEFRWTGDPKIAFYVVEVYGESLDLLWKSEKLRSLSLSLPEALLRVLLKGRKYTWLVRGFFPDGRAIESPPSMFTLR
jgi:hypothetical protein